MRSLRPPVPLSIEHRTDAFSCGRRELDEFLRQHALQKQSAMLSRTYVVLVDGPEEDACVVAYYTLAHVSIAQQDAPKRLSRGMPQTIPAMLMARFAVDLAHQGQGLGRSLFTDAIRRTWAGMNAGPAPMRLFVVDAKDEKARSFYERFDMVPSPANPMRLFLSYKSLRAAFEPSDVA